MYQLYINTSDIQINPLSDKIESVKARKSDNIYIYAETYKTF